MGDGRGAIENLLHLYAERMDAGDLPGVGALFAEAEYGAAGGPAVRGAEAVARLLERQVRLHEDGTPRTRHVTSNAIIELDEPAGTARARSCFTVFQAADGRPPEAIVLGRYHDAFARSDRSWHFTSRRIVVDFAGDLSRHLRHPGLAGPATP